MWMRHLILILLSYVKSQTCADSGVNEGTITYADCSICIMSNNVGDTDRVIEQGKWNDIDNFPSTQSNYALSRFTPAGSGCTITSYELSYSSGTYDPYPHTKTTGGSCTPTYTTFCMFTSIETGYPNSLKLNYYNLEPQEIIFYLCAKFNDNSIYCHPQRIRIFIHCIVTVGYELLQPVKEFFFQMAPLNTINFLTDIFPVFDLTITNPPAGYETPRPLCHLREYKVWLDAAATIPMTSDATYQLSSLTDPANTKLDVVSTSPINYKTVYVTAHSPFLYTTSPILEVRIYVCGFESVIPNTGFTPTAITASYDLGSGTKTIATPYAMATTGLESTFTGCPIVAYKFVDASGNDIGGTQFTVSDNQITVDTSSPWTQPMFLRAYTESGAKYDIPVTITVTCTSNIKYTTTQSLKDFYLPKAAINTIDFQTDIFSLFLITTGADPQCFFTEYQVFDDAALTTPTVSDSTYTLRDLLDPPNTQLDVVSTNSINFKRLFVRVHSPALVTQSEVLELNIYVCGFESIIPNSGFTPTMITANYVLGSGIQSLTTPYAVPTTSLESTQTICPIVGYKLVDSSGNNLSGTQFTIADPLIGTISVDTSTVLLNHQIFLRAYTMGQAIYDVAVSITIKCPSSVKYSTTQSLKVFTFLQQPSSKIMFQNEVFSLFQISSGADLQCLFTEYKVYDDAALTTPSVSDAIYTLTDLQNPPNTQLDIVSTSLINHKKFFVRVNSPYLVTLSDVLELNIYVCGFETVIPNTGFTPTTIIGTFDLGTGIQTQSHPYDVATTGLESTWPDCPIINYKLLDSNKNDMIGSQFTFNSFAINVDTSSPFSQLMYLRAYTASGANYDVPVQITVCGDEVIQSSAATIETIKATFFLNSGTQTVDHSAVTSLLSSTLPQCPIFAMKIVDASNVDITGSPLTPGATDISVDTTNTFEDTSYLRVYTKAGKYIDIPLDILICGNEQIVSSETPLSFSETLVYNTGAQFIDISKDILSKLSSTKERCPIIDYKIFNLDQLTPYTGPEVIAVDNNDLKIETFNGNDFQVYLRAETASAKYFFVPIKIKFCGKEVIKETKTEPITIDLKYQQSNIPKNFNLEFIQSSIVSTVDDCPVNKYTLTSGGQNSRRIYNREFVVLKNSEMLVYTTHVLKDSFFLEATSKGGVKHYVTVNLEVYPIENKEGISVNIAPMFLEELPTRLQIRDQILNITLPPIIDDYDQFYSIRIDCETLGSPFEYKNLTLLKLMNNTLEDNLKKLKGTYKEKIISYDIYTETIQFNIPNEIREYLIGEHWLYFELRDIQGNSRNYRFPVDVLEIEQSQSAVIQDIIREQEKATDAWAMIKSIDHFGNMTIRFNTPMITQGLNISHINNSICDVYVKSRDDWPLYVDVYNNQSLNLTWRVSYYQGDKMIVQLIFKNPLDISPLIEQDEIVFHVKNPQNFFVAERSNKDLSYDFRTLKHPIRKQMVHSFDAAEFVKYSERGGQALLIHQLFVFSMIFFIPLFEHLFRKINHLQLIVNLGLTKVPLQGNVITLYRFIIPVITFDWLAYWDIPSKFFYESTHLDFLGTSPVNIMHQMQDLFYQSHNTIMNQGTIALYFALFIVFCIIMLICKNIKQRKGKLLQFYRFLRQILMHGIISNLILECMMELIITGKLAFDVKQSEMFLRTKVQAYVSAAISILICLIIVPGYLIWVFVQDIEDIATIRAVRGLKLGVDMTNMSRVTFYIVFYLRRLIFLTICFYVQNDSVQTILLCIINILMICYVVTFKPMTTTRKNNYEIFNEVILYLCTFLLFLQTEFIPGVTYRYDFGWVLCSLVIFYILAHLVGFVFPIHSYIARKFFKVSQKQSFRRKLGQPHSIESKYRTQEPDNQDNDNQNINQNNLLALQEQQQQQDLEPKTKNYISPYSGRKFPRNQGSSTLHYKPHPSRQPSIYSSQKLSKSSNIPSNKNNFSSNHASDPIKKGLEQNASTSNSSPRSLKIPKKYQLKNIKSLWKPLDVIKEEQLEVTENTTINDALNNWKRIPKRNLNFVSQKHRFGESDGNLRPGREKEIKELESQEEEEKEYEEYKKKKYGPKVWK